MSSMEQLSNVAGERERRCLVLQPAELVGLHLRVAHEVSQ